MIRKILLLTFIFAGILNAANVNVNKETFNVNEQIVVNFSDMTVKNDDWIGIYPANSNDDWGNVVKWKWTTDITAGVLTFDPLPAGTYEVRAFYNNSLHSEARKQFTVTAVNPVATTVTTNKATYNLGETVTVNFSNMSGNQEDWIAVYSADSTNAWDNVVQWDWIAAQVNGVKTFNNLPVGDYEVRVFFNNTYNLEASHAFSVTNNNVAATVTTEKETYTPNENIVTTFNNVAGNEDDWMAIYPVGSSNAWDNVIQWDWIVSKQNGTNTFNPLPVGNYEVRVFFNNSYNLEASHAFEVKNTALTLASRKATYEPFELIYADFENMSGAESDWVGIFPVGADNEKDSALEWRLAKSLVNGSLSFNGLPAGAYEMRAYFDNLLKKTTNFTVSNQQKVTILYEDAETGVKDPRWIHYAGQYPVTVLNGGAQGSNFAIRHRAQWVNGENISGYKFPFGNVDKKMKFLELDMRIGLSSHIFNFGVVLETKNGGRRIIFASWMNHSNHHGGNDLSGNAIPNDPYTTDNYLHIHPGPTDYYLDTKDGSWIHYKINIEEKLRIIEPDNELIRITKFTTSGGDYDNLSLVSQ